MRMGGRPPPSVLATTRTQTSWIGRPSVYYHSFAARHSLIAAIIVRLVVIGVLLLRLLGGLFRRLAALLWVACGSTVRFELLEHFAVVLLSLGSLALPLLYWVDAGREMKRWGEISYTIRYCCISRFNNTIREWDRSTTPPPATHPPNESHSP